MVKVALIHIDGEWRTGKTITLERLPQRGEIIWTRSEERTSGADMFVVERVMHAECGTNDEEVVYLFVTPYHDYGNTLP